MVILLTVTARIVVKPDLGPSYCPLIFLCNLLDFFIAYGLSVAILAKPHCSLYATGLQNAVSFRDTDLWLLMYQMSNLPFELVQHVKGHRTLRWETLKEENHISRYLLNK